MRAWLHQYLIADETLMALVKGGIQPSQHPNSVHVPQQRPFLIHRFSTERSELRDGGVSVAQSSFVTISAHDTPGDYMRIDAVLERVKTLMESAQSTTDPTDLAYLLVRCEWDGGTEDLYDPDKETIFRQSRFRIIHK